VPRARPAAAGSRDPPWASVYASGVSAAPPVLLPYVVTAGFVLAVASPYLTRQPKDGFPLSTYPMFADNKDRMTTMQHLVGVTADGAEVFIPPHLVANDEVLQARATIDRATREGRLSQTRLCEEVAARVAHEPSLAGVVRLELRKSTYDSFHFFLEHAPPTKMRKFTACDVKRG
jgi:hypothetical protein